MIRHLAHSANNYRLYSMSEFLGLPAHAVIKQPLSPHATWRQSSRNPFSIHIRLPPDHAFYYESFSRT
jgi:hypothetical protein